MQQRIRAWEFRHQGISALLFLMFVLLVGAYAYCRADSERRDLTPYDTPAR